MKVFNIIACVLFTIFAGLQYNDPDFYLWIPLYLYTAVLCGLAAGGKWYKNLYSLGIFIYLCYAAYLFFDQNGVLNWVSEHQHENIAATMQAEKPWIEETREFFGLFLMIITLLVNLVYVSQKNSKHTRIKKNHR
ncbi:hypothetical protein COR50_01860 [Chitinophaga caeni]|uniref:Transmembrane family 220, helix n=1 Tax=Chitinophaga caeni TaxID=2029983 RepID=A0A291QQ05_9BACT|nr:transmembrane 220 family protein [Chitinophaga caeni]ATL46007.1 hypothetical protein COR50_01860 [Chitinophaga caeni]